MTGHALASGSRSGATITASGAVGQGLTSDTGFFLSREAGEGDDFRVCLDSLSTTGISGLMVRDHLDPDSSFVFAGSEGTGNTVLLFRHASGGPVQRIPFSATGSNRWFRLVVGKDTVYAYDAAILAEGTAGPWNFLAAVKIELAGGGFNLGRRSDFGGLFVSQGTTTFRDLQQTEALFWSEITTTNSSAVLSGTWTEISPDPDQFSESSTLFKRAEAGAGATVTYPLHAPVVGKYRVYVHAVAGNGSPLRAALVLGGNAQTPVDLDNLPSGVNSWLYLGEVTTSAGAGLDFAVQVLHPGTAGTTVYADAVRAVYLPERESGLSHYPVWYETPDARIIQSAGGTATNSIGRNNQGPDLEWTAGATSTKVLVGDGVLRFYFYGSGKRTQAGFAPWPNPLSNDPATIPYRFYNRADGKTQPWGGTTAPTFNYSQFNLLEIERIGSQVYFRKNHELIDRSPSPSTGPLYVDATFFDHHGYVNYTSVTGHWTDPSLVTASGQNLDFYLDNQPGPDPTPDALERWVVDADPEDDLQAIFQVRMTDDPDGDGLTHQQEYDQPVKTNPTRADSDGDGLNDGAELALGTQPMNPDSDGDGLDDGIEVSDVLGFDPLEDDSDGDGVRDGDEWEVIHVSDSDEFAGQDDVLPGDDFDGDDVSNEHESEDGTSLIDVEDYFHPVTLDRLFGTFEGMAYAIEETAHGIRSTRLTGNSAGPAYGFSHHEARDQTRLRFQFEAGSPQSRIRLGFARRMTADLPSGDVTRVELSFAPVTQAPVQVLFDGSVAAEVPAFTLSPADLVELRLDLHSGAPVLHIGKYEGHGYQPLVSPVELPAGMTDPGIGTHPMAVVVDLLGEDAGIHNARYRRVHDPDRDDDFMADLWEDLHGLNPLSALDAGSDLEPDGLTNLEEYRCGTDPNDEDGDGDGLLDGWEVHHGFDPTDDDRVLDNDGDGLSNTEELGLGIDPNEPDSDGDGLDDRLEVESPFGFNPDSSDSDGDGLLDGAEHQILSHSTQTSGNLTSQGQVHGDGDYDGDGVTNRDEGTDGTGAADPTSHNPGSVSVLPQIELKGRTHYTVGGNGGPSTPEVPEHTRLVEIEGWDPDLDRYEFLRDLPGSMDLGWEPTVIHRRFESVMVRPSYDFDGVTVIGQERVEIGGPLTERESILESYPQAAGWEETEFEYVDSENGYHWRVKIQEVVQGQSGEEGWGTPFEIYGSPNPRETDLLLEPALASAEESKNLHENAGDPPRPEVFWGSNPFPMRFEGSPGHPWGEQQRREHGAAGLAAPANRNFADFRDGIFPSVQWTEYWFQARGPIPAEMGPVKKTLLILATEKNAEDVVTHQSSGTVTFTLASGDLSSGTPEIEGLSSQTSEWLEARSDGVLWVKPDVARGVKREVSLLPIEFEDEEPYSGFDDITPDEGPWLMVPHDDENEIIAVTGATASSPIEFESRPKGQAYIVPDPSSVSSAREKLKFVGGALGDGEFLVPGMGGKFAESSVLKFAVYLQRELDVTVHMIAKATPGEAVKSPVNSFTESELSEFLNRIYKDQANVKINLTLKNEVPVDYDLSDHTDFWAEEGRINARNGIFDIRYNEGMSLEEQAILEASPEDPNSINVYVVGSSSVSPVAHRTYQGSYIAGSYGQLSGLARINERRIWVDSGDFEVGTTSFNQTDEDVMQTIAHEIGHILIGAGHADQPDGVVVYPCIVPNTDPAIRLMVSGDGQQAGKVPRTLLKCEWDKISEFFNP